MYFTKASAIALTSLLQSLAASAAPFLIPRATQSPSYASLPQPVFSPYYLYFGNPSTSSLADAFSSLNMKAATIGFASAPKGQCALTNDLNNLVSDVQAFIGKGGAVSLSFGGNLQDQADPRQHIQQACTDAQSLAKLIESAMSTFGTHNIEFDIEDNALLSDTAAAARLAQALVQVKQDISDTFIAYTVGSNPSGMPDEQNAYVQAAQSNGLSIDVLTLMTMNMGGSNIVQDAQTAVSGAAAQLEKIYQLQSGQGIKKMGMLPAIGVDNNGQVIDLTAATTLTGFAKAQGMHTLSYWSFNRDFAGGAGSTQSLQESSSPDQTTASQFFTTMVGVLSGGTGTSNVQGKLQLFGGKQQAQVPPPSNKQPGQKASIPGFVLSSAPAGAAAKLNGTNTSDASLPSGTPGNSTSS